MSAKKAAFNLFFGLCVISLGFLAPLMGANYYVRSDSPGGCTEANPDACTWSNAYPSLPATLVRGATYYLASGRYGSYLFTTPASGSIPITIKKATPSDHGIETGWSATYGDGVASFPSVSFMTSYVVFDGVTGGGPGHWNTGHGFEIVRAGTACRDTGSLISLGSNVLNLTIQHVHAHGSNNDYPINGVKGVSGAENIQLSYNSIHTIFGPAYHIGNWKNVVVEYSYMADVRSTGNPDPKGFCPDWHAEGVSSLGTNDNLTFRNNLWDQIGGTAVFAGISIGTSLNWKIYGNVISRSVTPLYYYYEPAGTNKQTMTNLEFYNNTIVDMPGDSQGGIVIQAGSNNKIMNNVWSNNIANSFSISGTHDTNYFSDNRRVADCSPACDKDAAAAEGETSPQITSGNPFINWTGSNPLSADFRLKTASSNGTPLSSPFNVDPLGAVRGSGGTWDRGAYEYTAAAPPDPSSINSEAGFLPFKNVFNPIQGSLRINLSAGENISSLMVYDKQGAEVKELSISGNNAVWDGKNSSGQMVASGTYLVVLKQGDKIQKKKVVVVK